MKSPYQDVNLKEEPVFVIANKQLDPLTYFEVLHLPTEKDKVYQIKARTNLKKDGPFFVRLNREFMIKESDTDASRSLCKQVGLSIGTMDREYVPIF